MVNTIMLKQRIEASVSSGPETLVEVAATGFSGVSGEYEAVRDILFSSKYPHKIEASELAPDSFFSLVILLLAYSSIDPNLVGTPVFQKRQDTVFHACNSLGIDRSLIEPISTIETPLYQALDRV
tara:strand:- start:7882 stop:8256 length:375 start_codon:yes stop_codon:yes gene_type:complete